MCCEDAAPLSPEVSRSRPLTAIISLVSRPPSDFSFLLRGAVRRRVCKAAGLWGGGFVRRRFVRRRFLKTPLHSCSYILSNVVEPSSLHSWKVLIPTQLWEAQDLKLFTCVFFASVETLFLQVLQNKLNNRLSTKSGWVKLMKNLFGQGRA